MTGATELHTQRCQAVSAGPAAAPRPTATRAFSGTEKQRLPKRDPPGSIPSEQRGRAEQRLTVSRAVAGPSPRPALLRSRHGSSSARRPHAEAR